MCTFKCLNVGVASEKWAILTCGELDGAGRHPATMDALKRIQTRLRGILELLDKGLAISGLRPFVKAFHLSSSNS
jgi:hypothetical protein